MTPVLIAVAVAVALLLLLIVLRLRPRAERTREAPRLQLDTVHAWPPRATRVLDNTERQAYELLRHALPTHMILAQVSLQRFIKVPTRNSYAEWLRRVGQLHADLVVCDPSSQVLAVVEIETDDEPDGRVRRRRERLLRVLKAAQVPVHVWRAGALPSAASVREAILPAPEVPELSDEPVHGARGDASLAEDTQREEPPPSTWFDDLDSAPAPLGGAEAPPPRDAARRERS